MPPCAPVRAPAGHWPCPSPAPSPLSASAPSFPQRQPPPHRCNTHLRHPTPNRGADVLVCPLCAAGDTALAANEDCCCACCIAPTLCIFPCYWAHLRQAQARKYSISDPLSTGPLGALLPCLMFTFGCREWWARAGAGRPAQCGRGQAQVAQRSTCPVFLEPRTPRALRPAPNPLFPLPPQHNRPLPAHSAAQSRQGGPTVWGFAGPRTPLPNSAGHALGTAD